MKQISSSRHSTIRKATDKPVFRRPSLRAGSIHEIDFTDLLANGQAVGRAGEMVVFCFGPLPQERAVVRVTEVRRSYAIGEMQRLLVASASRAQPFCKVFGTCGGCQLQHLSYPEQLAWKRRVVRDALARIGGFSDIDVRDPIGMAVPRAYRNKMSLVVDHTMEKPRLGFYRQRSHDIVPIEECPIVMRRLDRCIPALNAACVAPETAAAFAAARHVVARGSSESTVVALTTPRASENVASAAAPLLSLLPGAGGVVNSYGLASENAIVGRNFSSVGGSDEIVECIDGIRYCISSETFFQVNIEIVSRIFDFLRPAIKKPRNVIDLYCGAGTFALFFAKEGCNVYGIEESPKAVAEAEHNAEHNGLAEHCRFRSGHTNRVLYQEEAKRALSAAEIVFLDPPRKGSDEATLGILAVTGVREIWYLSCEPATLARDLKFLAAKGYAIATVQPFDMFPQTGHIETLVMLGRSERVG